jgi:hypothetical protein
MHFVAKSLFFKETFWLTLYSLEHILSYVVREKHKNYVRKTDVDRRYLR